MMSDVVAPRAPTREPDSIAVLLFSADEFALHALTQLLEAADAGLWIVAGVAQTDRLAEVAAASNPRLAIVDCGRAEDDETWLQVVGVCATVDIPVVALVHTAERGQCLAAWRSGARALVSRTAPAPEITSAVHAVASGFTVLCPAASRLVRRQAAPVDERLGLSSAATVSPRELEVILRLCEGKSNAEVGQALGIAESTVKTHLARVMAKWCVRDRVEVVLTAARLGLAHLN